MGDVGASFIERSDAVELRGRRVPKTAQLRKNEPHPVSALATGSQLIQGGREDRLGARRPVSQIVRFMLYTRLASPIFTRALARPIVRTTSPIGPFSCANTCSTAARTFDLAPFARAVCLGIGLRGGFLRWICERRPFSARSLSFARER